MSSFVLILQILTKCTTKENVYLSGHWQISSSITFYYPAAKLSINFPIWSLEISKDFPTHIYSVLSKVYVDMDILFLFPIQLGDLFVKNEDAPCYARPIQGKGALALGQFSTRAILSHTMTGNRQKVVERVWQKYRQSKESARSESF